MSPGGINFFLFYTFVWFYFILFYFFFFAELSRKIRHVIYSCHACLFVLFSCHTNGKSFCVSSNENWKLLLYSHYHKTRIKKKEKKQRR
ncbi:hypothetical protein PUN28_017372 [Cardiocondyla obscurior]|uniref:Secreted protein n=1 Tax=Cardiocondyla obscurior TaxID=286306 RepID=A0AAW2ESB9_9HYME